MPISTDIIQNSPLRGDELQAVILDSLSQVLKRDGLLSSMAAFRKASWTLTLEIHTGNPLSPTHTILGNGKHGGSLTPDEQAEGTSTKMRVEDGFTSPNLVRVQSGLPITTTVRKEGEFFDKQFHYDKDQVEPKSPATVTYLDTAPQDVQAGVLGAGPGDLAQMLAMAQAKLDEAKHAKLKQLEEQDNVEVVGDKPTGIGVAQADSASSGDSQPARTGALGVGVPPIPPKPQGSQTLGVAGAGKPNLGPTRR